MFAALSVLAAAAAAATAAAAAADHRHDRDGAPAAPPGGPWTLAWAEEFGGTAINTSRWTVKHNGTHGDLEQQLYLGSAVSLDGAGHLVLRTARAGPDAPPTGPDGRRKYNFTSGWVDTEGKVETAFGWWEIRAQLPSPAARGIWPAHWLMPRFDPGSSATDWNCWPVGGEIDIMEATGGIYNNTVMGTYHWGANCSADSPPPPGPPTDPSNCTCGCGCDLHRLSNVNGKFECVHPEGDPWHCEKAHDFSKGFHVFAVEWGPTAIRWYVDGNLYWTRTLGKDNVTFIPSQPLYIILNTAIQPAIWNKGAGEEGSYPVEHTIDYVRVWERQLKADDADARWTPNTLRDYGYFWGRSLHDHGGSWPELPTLAGHSTTAIVMNGGANATAMARADIVAIKQLRAMNMTAILGTPGNVLTVGQQHMQPQFEARWAEYWSLVQPYAGSIRAFYPYDEPTQAEIGSGNYTACCKLLKTSAPSVPILAIMTPSEVLGLEAGVFELPAEVDIIGFDNYCCWAEKECEELGKCCWKNRTMPHNLRVVADYAAKRGGTMVVVPDAEHNVPYTAGCGKAGQPPCVVNNATQHFKIRIDLKYYEWCAAEKLCVAMLPFLWNTVHTSKYEIIGAAQQPLLLQALTRLGSSIKGHQVPVQGVPSKTDDTAPAAAADEALWIGSKARDDPTQMHAVPKVVPTDLGTTPNCSGVFPPQCCPGWGFRAMGGFPRLPWQGSWSMRHATVAYFLGTATGMDPPKELAAEAELGLVGIGWQLNNIPTNFKHLEGAEKAQAVALKAARPDVKIAVVRNTAVAMEAWDCVRAALRDHPSFWLQCGSAPCVVPWSTHEPSGPRSVPSYLFNFSNPAAADWFVREYVGSAANSSEIDAVYFDSGINASAVVGTRLDLARYEADAQEVFTRAVGFIRGRGKWATGWSLGSMPELTNETCDAVMRQWISAAAAAPNSTFQPSTSVFANVFRFPRPYKGDPISWQHSDQDQNATVAAFMLARAGDDALLELRVPHGAYWWARDIAVDAPSLQTNFGRPLRPAWEHKPSSKEGRASSWTREFERGHVSLDCSTWRSRFVPKISATLAYYHEGQNFNP